MLTISSGLHNYVYRSSNIKFKKSPPVVEHRQTCVNNDDEVLGYRRFSEVPRHKTMIWTSESILVPFSTRKDPQQASRRCKILPSCNTRKHTHNHKHIQTHADINMQACHIHTNINTHVAHTHLHTQKRMHTRTDARTRTQTRTQSRTTYIYNNKSSMHTAANETLDLTFLNLLECVGHFCLHMKLVFAGIQRIYIYIYI